MGERRGDKAIIMRSEQPKHQRITPALSMQLMHTAHAVWQVTQGRTLDDALAKVGAGMRPGVQALSFHTLRYLGTAQALVQLLVLKPPKPEVRAFLCVALALCMVDTLQADTSSGLDDMTGMPSYPSYVLVSQAVQAIKADTKMRAFAPLVNAVLRRFLRDAHQWVAQAKETSTQGHWNFQPWWVKKLLVQWSELGPKIMQAAQKRAPMTLRVNARWGTPQQGAALLQQHGISSTISGAYALDLHTPVSTDVIPGFAQGYFSVQAGAAQLAAPLLLDHEWLAMRCKVLGRPLRVLDACAAPGGKTAHMLEIAPPGSINVLALDIDAQRLARVKETLERIGVQAELRAADAEDAKTFQCDEDFDAILLDAPCTASGIVRRHPDIRWLRRESDVAALSAQQQRLLDVLWSRLQPGGRLLYCTCSVFMDEGENVAQNFVLRHNHAKRLHAPGHLLPVAGVGSSTMAASPTTAMAQADGFYYALFEK